MRKYLIILVLFLSACNEPPETETCSTDWVQGDPARYERVLNSCLANTAKARAGRDYKTDDDEDYDAVVSECIRAAQISTPSIWVKTCVPIKRNPNPAERKRNE